MGTKPGICPVSDDVVAEESPPHITGYGCDDDVLPAAVVAGRTEDENWADLSSGLLRKNEWNQNDVAPITADRTQRLGDCSRGLRAQDPFWKSCTRCPHHSDPHGSDP